MRKEMHLLVAAQVLLENAQRGSAPPEGSDLTSDVPRVPGIPADAPLVPVPGTRVEGIYTQARTSA